MRAGLEAGGVPGGAESFAGGAASGRLRADSRHAGAGCRGGPHPKRPRRQVQGVHFCLMRCLAAAWCARRRARTSSPPRIYCSPGWCCSLSQHSHWVYMKMICFLHRIRHDVRPRQSTTHPLVVKSIWQDCACRLDDHGYGARMAALGRAGGAAVRTAAHNSTHQHALRPMPGHCPFHPALCRRHTVAVKPTFSFRSQTRAFRMFPA